MISPWLMYGMFQGLTYDSDQMLFENEGTRHNEPLPYKKSQLTSKQVKARKRAKAAKRSKR